MSRSSRQDAPLAYFQPSPVRGQLEPHSSETRPGWRYLQCTDTPNELKVLVPPRTAALYSRLLQLEAADLAKGPHANWERILEIRHLKDRMLRKCQRISKFAAPPPGGASAAFRVVNAPPDFRLKEMERWLKDTDSGDRRTRDALRRSVDSEKALSQGDYSRPGRSNRAPTTQRTSTRTGTSGKKRASMSSQSTDPLSTRSPAIPPKPAPSVLSYSQMPERYPFLSPVMEERSPYTPTSGRDPAPLPSPNIYAAVLADPPHMPIDHALPEEQARQHVISPDPLPHLYRPPSGYIQPSLEPMPESDYQHMLTRPSSQHMPHPVTEMPEASLFAGSDLSSVAPTVPSKAGYPPRVTVESVEDLDAAEAGMARPTLGRRRSSLKQHPQQRPIMPNSRFSLNGSHKVVSWAMDRDWSEHMTKYDHIVYAAEYAEDELQQARAKFREEIQGVKDMRENIAVSLERLKLETDRLKQEETALRHHEENMTASFDLLQAKEAAYKDKVHAVLEETKRVVVAADSKRDGQVGVLS